MLREIHSEEEFVRSLESGKTKTTHDYYRVSQELNKNLRRAGFELLLSLATVTATCCESALLSTDVEAAAARHVSRAKKTYAAVLRYAGRLSFSVRDVREFEWRTIRLERAIQKIEQRYLRNTSEDLNSPPTRARNDY